MLEHLTDEELQLYAIDAKQCDGKLVEHVHVCSECKAKVEVYKVLMTRIRQQPVPSFEFDLAGLVLQKLPQPRPKAARDKLTTWVLVFVSAISFAILTYYFLNYQPGIFQGIAAIAIYLVVVSALTVLAALVFDMYKKYEAEMKVLDLY